MILPDYLVKWIAGVIAAASITMSGWAGRTIIQQGNVIAAHTQQLSDISSQLTAMDKKLDRLLERPH